MVTHPCRGITSSSMQRGSYLELVSSGELLVAGHRGSKGEECGEQPSGAFVADGQPVVAGQPGEGPFDDPAVPAQPGAGFDAAGGDAASAQPGPQVLVVVAGVGVQLGRTLPPRATPAADGGDGLHQRHQPE